MWAGKEVLFWCDSYLHFCYSFARFLNGALIIFVFLTNLFLRSTQRPHSNDYWNSWLRAGRRCWEKERWMTNAYKTKLSFARITLVVCLIISLSLYFSYKRTIENEKPIDYSLVNQTQTYWRGTNYNVDVIYDEKKYHVSISRKWADSIDMGIMPNLYYHKFTSSVISNYHKSAPLKVISVLGILVFLSFLMKARKQWGCFRTPWFAIHESPFRFILNNVCRYGNINAYEMLKATLRTTEKKYV